MASFKRIWIRIPGTKTCAAFWSTLIPTAYAIQPWTITPILTSLTFSGVLIALDKILGADTPPNRWMFLTLLHTLLPALGALAGPTAWCVTYGTASLLTTLGVLGTTRMSKLKIAALATFLPLNGMTWTVPWIGPPSWYVPVLIAGTSLLIGILTIVTLDSISTPGLGVPATQAIEDFLCFKSGRESALDKIFSNLKTVRTVKVPIRVVAFKRESDGRVVGAFVIPWVHPGPLGHVGGGDLPGMIVKKLKEKGVTALVFHSTTTHDYNPATREDALKVVDKVLELVKRAEETDEGYERSSTVEKGKSTDTRVQMIGDVPIVVLSKYPEPSDDIDVGVGMQIEREINGWVIDAHNSFGDPDKGRVYPLTKDHWKLYKDAIKCIESVSCSEKYYINVGFSNDEINVPGVGKGGVSVAYFKVGVGDFCYVVYDANNIEKHVREYIEREISKEFGCDVIVCTTDSHEVNIRGYNPLGWKISKNELKKLGETTKDVVKKAMESVEKCKAIFVEDFINIKVTGPGSYQVLSYITDAIWETTRKTLPLTFACVIFISAAIGVVSGM